MKHIKELYKEHGLTVDKSLVLPIFLDKVESNIIAAMRIGEDSIEIKLSPQERAIYKFLSKELKKFSVILKLKNNKFILTWSI